MVYRDCGRDDIYDLLLGTSVIVQTMDFEDIRMVWSDGIQHPGNLVAGWFPDQWLSLGSQDQGKISGETACSDTF